MVFGKLSLLSLASLFLVHASFAAPLQYFSFASDPSIVLRQNYSGIAREFGGNFMLGGDAGYPNVGSEFVQIMNKAKSFGAKKHVYLEGPGGPTGDSGIAGDECDRMMARAQGVGIPLDRRNCSNGSSWIRKWNATGWWVSTIKEIKYFNTKYGATSFEIDNLYRAGVESSSSVLAFLKRFQAAKVANKLDVTLMLKNLTVDDLALLKRDIDSGRADRLLRSTVTDFMISEEGFSGEWSAIGRAAKAIGVKMLKSTNTNNYQARGYYAR
jgi:hypothetical protein